MAAKQLITCVSCPMGCELTVTVEDGVATDVAGNACKRGETYGRAEATDPQRVLTMLVSVAGETLPASCRTASPIPKRLIPQAVAELRGVVAQPPVHLGQVLLANVCNTGVDVIATKDVPSL